MTEGPIIGDSNNQSDPRKSLSPTMSHDKDKETSENDDKDKHELILNLIERRYDYELQRTTDFDSKASGLIGYVTIVTGLLVGLGTFDILDKLSKVEFFVPYFSGIGLLLFSIVSSLMAIRIKKYTVVAEFGPLREVLGDPAFEYRSVIRRVFISFGNAIANNSVQNDDKARWIQRSWFSLIMGLILVLTYVMIFLYEGDS